VDGHTDGALEERAQVRCADARDPREANERHVLGEVGLDVLGDVRELARREARRRHGCAMLREEMNGERHAEALPVDEPVRRARPMLRGERPRDVLDLGVTHVAARGDRGAIRIEPHLLSTVVHGRTITQGLRLVAWVAIILCSLVFVYRALHLLQLDPAVMKKYFPFRWILVGHIVGGMLALITGPFQLSKTFRARYRRVHRVMGRVYVSATSVGAVCAFLLASLTAPVVSWGYALSLHMLSIVWLSTGLLAWRTAVQKRFAQHEEWATRSYIATIAFVAQSLSFDLPFMTRLGTSAEMAATIIWFSWTVPTFAYACTRARRTR